VARACNGEHSQVAKLCRDLISSNLADADVYEAYGDALLALEQLKEALKAYGSAYTLVDRWNVLQGWQLLMKKAQLQDRIQGARRQGGSAGSSGPSGGGQDVACAEKPIAGDDYTVLGLSSWQCTKRSLKSAFRKAALVYHPDKYTGTKACAEMHFKRLSGAHDRLVSVCT